MKNLLLIATAGAALLACQKETIDPGAEKKEIAAANAKANAKNVVLPPSITATKTYRCKDNSLLYIDWLTDGSARVKTAVTDVGTPVIVGAEGTPSLKGDAQAASVTYNGSLCKT